MNKNFLSPEELVSEIEGNNREFIQKISKFSPKNLNKIINEESWTAGQVVEHIIKSNEGILNQLISGKATSTGRRFYEQVKLIKDIFSSPDKMKTDPILEPNHPPHYLGNLMKSLNEQQALKIKVINENDLKKLNSELQFPPAPNGLTKYEWLIFIIEHTRRHSKQLENIYNEIS